MRLPFIFIIVLFVVALLEDLYILNDIKRYLSGKRKQRARIFQFVLMGIGYGLLITALCIPVRGENSNILPVMWVIYSFLSIYFAKTIYILFSLAGLLTALWRRHARRDKRKILHNYGALAALPVCLAGFVMMWVGVFYTRYKIQINKVDIYSSRLPKAFDGYKLVQISDLHVGTWGNDTTFIANVVDSVNSLSPDLILFTGDIVNRRAEELKPFKSVLRRLKAKDGVYSVLGNHDYGDYIDWRNDADKEKNRALLREWEKEMGWKLLNNDAVLISKSGEEIALIGVENWGEPPFSQYGNLKAAYPSKATKNGSLKDTRFKILLSHNPKHWEEEVTKETNIDLTLSGHTHAMQMAIGSGKWKWSPSSFKYKNWGGLYEGEGITGKKVWLYVNIGTGEVGLPARLGVAYPEITEITLKSER